MRKTLLAALILTLVVVADVVAQVPKAKITGARAGFTGGSRDGSSSRRLKSGQWGPLSIDVQAGNDGLSAYEIVVETTDGDDLQNVYVERRFLPPLQPKETAILQSFVRVGTSQSEVTIKIRSREVADFGRTLSEVKLKPAQGDYAVFDPDKFYYLSLGGPLIGLKQALATRINVGGFNPDLNPNEALEPEENWVRRFAHADRAPQLPTSWFGYQTADAIVLATSNKEFIDELDRDNDDKAKAQREALAEWVRRGGRLVVSVGRNHQEVQSLLGKLKVIDLDVRGQATGLKTLKGLERWSTTAVGYPTRTSPDKPGVFADQEVASLEPRKGKPVRVLASEMSEARVDYPLIVSAPHGLGRVIVVAVDVDQPPFTTWRGQKNFWEALKREVEPPNLEGNPNQQQVAFNNPFGRQTTELGARLVDGMELFPDVPVISFGWVALFIVVYILIVGPLDYFFLKKVVKRLELTWVTFPTVVVVISAVAYFAAYYLKGNDLRINKVDIVDIDLHGNRAYGTTWFTLFSPRIQNYTVGVEPNEPHWGKEPPSRNTTGKERKEDWARDRYAPLVGWLSRPEVMGNYGSRSGGSGGLFRRAYDYAPEATGLVGVPIQVWSTKSFVASYDRPLNDGELIEADLKFTKANPKKVGGRIVSHLPVELHDVVLFHAGVGYKLDRLVPNQPVNIDQKDVVLDKQGDEPLQQWFATGFTRATRATPASRRGPMYNQQTAQPVGTFVKSILFHGLSQDANSSQSHNSTLRTLDQRWRLDTKNRDEVILFGRVMPTEGAAETVGTGGESPTRLWLGELPGYGSRPSLAGTLMQETYVRVFIPVAPQ